MAGAIIALAGKGGSGKTTMASMLLRQLIRMQVKPILAVDADPNATLGLTLGADVEGTISDLRDRMGEAAQDVSTIPKTRLVDQWLNELLTEEVGFDMLTMGRPEGPKCYCYVNGLLRRYLSLLRKNYACVIVDCEAGMEYLSRLVVDDVEALIMVAEATPVGLVTAGRIAELVKDLPMTVKRQALAVNKVGQYQDDIPPLPENSKSMDRIVQVPFDEDLAVRCARGEAVDDEAGKSARSAIEELAAWSMGLSAPARPALPE